MARKKILSEFGLKDLDSTKTKKKITKRKTKNKNKIAPITSNIKKIQVKQYIHEKQKRANNPPVGLVTPDSDVDMPAKTYSFDPHLDPQLEWSGKIENPDFEVDTVSLHRHERIDPMTIIGKIMKKQGLEQQTLFPFFEQSENNLPLRDAIEFYKHDQNWSNRLIAGDSLLVMNSLLEKEGMTGKTQMIFLDPPYGITYKSNFQPFVNKRDPKDGKDEDLNQEPETIKAFRDTWELGVHSYLTFLHDRLKLCRELLHESGSIFVQIGEENYHYVRSIMDEIFGNENFCTSIVFRKTGGETNNLLGNTSDYLLWFAKDKKKVKYHQLYFDKKIGEEGAKEYTLLELENGETRSLTPEEKINQELLPENSKIFATWPIVSPGFSEKNSQSIELEYKGEKFVLNCPKTNHWKLGVEGTKSLWEKNRLLRKEGLRIYKKYLEDFPFSPFSSLWVDTRGETRMKYVVQTSTSVVMRCILMTTDPGDLVFDPTCGSGTTAYCSEYLGRRWMTCDTSRVSLFIARQRLMTSLFPYYKLLHDEEGLQSGFDYEMAENKTMSSVAKDIPGELITLYDKPKSDATKTRICGPFTVEAVPSPTVKSIDTTYEKSLEIDSSISRTVENKRQQDWRDELLNTGVRGKGGQRIDFSRVETHPASKWIHAIAETKDTKPQIVAVSFGPEHSPLEKNQVALTISEAQKIVPKPELIIFASLQFDPEAAKDIDELQWPGVQVLKVQVNSDLLTLDLKKKRSSNESFWLMGQPDAELKKQDDGKYIVEIKGFDYYNTKSGEIESGDSTRIAMWMLDTDYDERSLYPQQIFFPMSGSSDGWSKLKKTLKSEIDEELIEHFKGTQSLPFIPGSNNQVAVKIIDDRGIESIRIIKIE